MRSDPLPSPVVTAHTHHGRVLWLIAALLTLPALPGPRPAGAQQRPQFRAQVELVQLQVGVADGDGAFVGALSAEDFVVVVDGDPRPAQVAYEIDLRDKDGAGGGALAGPAPPSASRPVAARRHFVLFFDFSFTTRRGVREERRAALEFLDNSLHPSDLVAIATVNRYGIEVLSPFTSDRKKARRYVADLRLANATDRIVLGSAEVVVGAEALFVEEYIAAVSSYTSQLEQFGEMLQAIEGRKHVVMFSTGFRDAALIGDSPEILAGMKAAVEAFREADAVIHAVDPRGLRQDVDGHQALTYLAYGTGGEAYWNMNKLTPAMEQIEATTARFYLIGYQKKATDAGTVEIQVRVLRPGVKVTSSPERFTPPPEYRQMNAVQRQLQLAEALADDFDVRRIAVSSQVVAFPAPSGGIPSVVLFFEIPGLELERLATERGDDELQFEIAGFALANDDAIVDEFRRTVDVDIARMRAGGPLAEQSFRYADRVEVPPGKGRLRLLLRESVIGELTATTRRYYALGEQEAQRMILARPMIVDDQSLPSLPNQDRPFDPLEFNKRRLAPIADPQAATGAVVDVLILLYNVPLHPVSGEILARISIELEETASIDVYPISDFRILATSSTEASAATQLLVRVPIPAHMPPGDARLWVRVADPVTGDQRQEQTKLFVIPR